MKYKHIKNLWDVTKVVYKEKLSFYEKINGLEDSTLLRGQSFSN